MSTFGEGNEAAVTHGAHSETAVAPVREREREVLVGSAPWLAQGRFVLALEALADTRAKVRLLTEWLDEHGLFDGDGSPRTGPFDMLVRMRRLELDVMREVGLTPRAYASLAQTWGQASREADLAEQRAEGRRLREAHE